ncbi:MAG: amidohydrolase family protein [Gemmatales bacterium]|nr:amidohydrolase family protein [Gemmatales bacterium]MDW7993690.1 amidohydrolase family protein [Gemmatales bacterium]
MMQDRNTTVRIYAEWMFDGDDVVPGSGILLGVSGSHIAAVRAGANPEEADLQFSGCSVLPGLIDSHVHLCFSAGRTHAEVVEDLLKSDGDQLLQRAIKHAQQALKAGITTLRDCGGPTQVLLALRTLVNQGKLPGPEVLVSGSPITTPKGHLYYVGAPATGAEDVERRTDDLLEAGVDFVKLIVTGGNMTPESNRLGCQYSAEEIKRAVRCAERANRYIAAHVLNREGLRRAVLAGVRTLEHCSWRTGLVHHEFDEGLARLMRQQGQIASLTMSAPTWRKVWPEMGKLDPELFRDLEDRFASERQMIESGVRFILHTDAGVRQTPVGISLIYGLRAAQLELGLSSVECLRAVTGHAADALGLVDRGRLRVGQRADIVVVKGRPWQDLSALHEIRGVWCGGKRCV